MPLSRTAMLAYARLLHELDSGVFVAGGRLPGERELSERLAVSRATLRAALAELEANGKVQRHAQRGWFVPPQPIGEPPSTLQSFSEMAFARGLTPNTEVTQRLVRAATLVEAQALRVAPASPVLQLDRLRGMEDTIMCFDVVVLPGHYLDALRDVDFTNVSLYDTLWTECGVSIYRSAYTLTASVADARMAALLRMRTGDAVLIGEEVAYNDDGLPVLLGHNTYRGDAYRFQADLFRRSDRYSGL